MLSRFPTRCRHCGEKFSEQELGKRLHAHCVDDWITATLNKQAAKKAKERKAREAQAKREIRARKAALKTIPELIKEADRVFAAFIRTRDRLAGYPCISSGKPLDWSGNQVDAGHYRSRGAASHLRYHPDNCHAQSKHDNQWKAGNVVEYRIRLVERIGIERVQALESDNKPVKWTKDGLLDVIATYKAEKRELEKQ